MAICCQIFFINQIDLGSASPYFYPLFYSIFILFLPLSISPILLIVFAFGEGLVIDAFMNTGGLHTSALILLAILRPPVLKLVSPREDYDATKPIGIQTFGFRRFSLLILILSMIQHIWFFSIEYFKFSELHIILSKAVLSALLSTVLIILTNYLTSKTNK